MVGASVRRGGLTYELQHFQGLGGPSPCGFTDHGLEPDALGLAGVLGAQVGALRVRVCYGCSQGRAGCLANNILSLWCRYGKVECNRHSSRPTRKIYVGWSPLGPGVRWSARQKQAGFLNLWAETCSATEVENDVSHTIVPNDAIPARAASTAMVAKRIQHVVAQRAKAGVYAFWDAQSVSHLGSKLVGRDRGAFGAVRDRLLYFSSTFFLFGQQRGFGWALSVVAAGEAGFVDGG